MASEFFWPLDMSEASPLTLPQFFHTFGEGGEECGWGEDEVTAKGGLPV